MPGQVLLHFLGAMFVGLGRNAEHPRLDMFQVPEEMICSASFIGFRGSPQSEIAWWSPLGTKVHRRQHPDCPSFLDKSKRPHLGGKKIVIFQKPFGEVPLLG